MPDSIKFTELPSGTLGANSIFATAEEAGGGSFASTKVNAANVGNYLVGALQYAGINTDDKTVEGALNELLVYALNIAEEYDSTATYDIGDFVIHSGVLYKCTTAISTPEAWTSAHWTSTLVVDNFGSGGASVTLGTTVPLDASGENGDLYVQYEALTYKVVEYFVKINSSWRKSPYSRIVALTQAEYDLITPDPTTLYIITDKQGSYVKLPVITDAWNGATSYTVGSYCIHNDTLWKCTTANSNQEPTSGSTYWDDTSVADELNELNAGLSGVEAYRCKYAYTAWGTSKGSEFTHVPFFRVQIDLDYYIAANGGDYINIRNIRTGTTQASQIPSGQTSVSVTVDGHTFTKNVSGGNQNLVITTSSNKPIFIEYYL